MAVAHRDVRHLPGIRRLPHFGTARPGVEGGTMICVYCDCTITGKAIVAAEGHSASGARPDSYAHQMDDPECTGRRAAPSILHRQLDEMPAPPPRRR